MLGNYTDTIFKKENLTNTIGTVPKVSIVKCESYKQEEVDKAVKEALNTTVTKNSEIKMNKSQYTVRYCRGLVWLNVLFTNPHILKSTLHGKNSSAY